MKAETNNNTLYHYEVLRARYEIRDFYLNNIVREVYENIGQTLSLAGLQIATLEQSVGQGMTHVSSRELVGQTIKDLRNLCRQFYPDRDILGEEGFEKVLSRVIRVIFPGHPASIETEGAEKEFDGGVQLICFKMLMEMLISIRESKGSYRRMTLSYQRACVVFCIQYKGEDILKEARPHVNHYLSLREEQS